MEENCNPYQYLNNLNKFGSEGGFKPGLERVRALLSYFNDPQEKLKIVHVAGTNGKGSTIAFLKSIYQQSGCRVGVYTSPHLVSFNERIVINNEEISDQELDTLIGEIAPLVEEISVQHGKPTYFEVVTVIALIYFYRLGVDLVLLETGLGGRLDATNVIKRPLLSVITNISLEHTSILGDNLEDISREKAGIIKDKCPVVTGVQDEKALRVIKKTAGDNKADLIHIGENYKYNIISSSLEYQKFSIIDNNRTEEYSINLLGEHQIRNAVLALAVVKELQDEFPVKDDDIKRGLYKADWPGRLEVLNKKPYIIVDGAHNEQGIRYLTKFLQKQTHSQQKVTIIFSVLRDKNILLMLRMLQFRSNVSLILTRNKDKRSLMPGELKEIAVREGIKGEIYPDLETALMTAIGKASSDDFICITGSLYNVAEVKKIIKRFDY